MTVMVEEITTAHDLKVSCLRDHLTIDLKKQKYITQVIHSFQNRTLSHH